MVYDDALPPSFFSADVVIIDVTDRTLWGTLAYVVGVRAALGDVQTLILIQRHLLQKFRYVLALRMENQQRYKVVLYDPKSGAAFLNTAREINRLIADDAAAELAATETAVAEANGTAPAPAAVAPAPPAAAAAAAAPAANAPEPEHQQISLCTRLSQIFENMERGIMKRRKNEFKEQFLKTCEETDPITRLQLLQEITVRFQTHVLLDPTILSPDVLLALIRAYKNLEKFHEIVELSEMCVVVTLSPAMLLSHLPCCCHTCPW